MRCSKRLYTTQGRAVSALVQIRTRIETDTIEDFCRANRAYFCYECGGWHLTKTPLGRKAVISDVLPGEY